MEDDTDVLKSPFHDQSETAQEIWTWLLVDEDRWQFFIPLE
jgi:hypothetical protein